MFIDCRIIAQPLMTPTTTNDSTLSLKHCLLALLDSPAHWPSGPAATPSHSQPCITKNAQGDAGSTAA